MRFAALLVALAVPSLAVADSLVLFPAVGRPTLATVSGQVLETSPEHEATPLTKNVRRLTAKGREGVEVKLSFAGQVRTTQTGEAGVFEASFPAPSQAPFPVGPQPLRAIAGEATAEGLVEIVSDAAPFLVVSDFDDTVAVTNVQSKSALLKSALLSDETSQPAVEGMAAFYRCLREGSDPAPAFFMVTGSPLEFGPRLQAFLERDHFPFAALHLRHLSTKTLSHYKEPVLRALLSRFPQRFVLVGDSGEADPETYARIRAEFPGRVLAIFIHDVGRSDDPKRFQDMVLFKAAPAAVEGAAARKLVTAECAAKGAGGSKK